MNIFILEHVRDQDGCDDIKRIGVYVSRSAAEEARVRAGRLPGFSDHPDGFSVSEYELGRDHWTSGFVSVDGAGERSLPPGEEHRAA